MPLPSDSSVSCGPRLIFGVDLGAIIQNKGSSREGLGVCKRRIRDVKIAGKKFVCAKARPEGGERVNDKGNFTGGSRRLKVGHVSRFVSFLVLLSMPEIY